VNFKLTSQAAVTIKAEICQLLIRRFFFPVISLGDFLNSKNESHSRARVCMQRSMEMQRSAPEQSVSLYRFHFYLMEQLCAARGANPCANATTRLVQDISRRLMIIRFNRTAIPANYAETLSLRIDTCASKIRVIDLPRHAETLNKLLLHHGNWITRTIHREVLHSNIGQLSITATKEYFVTRICSRLLLINNWQCH
jgi:hypothetical protein